MMQPILCTHLYISLFLHIIIVTLHVAGDSPAAYCPVEDITIRCGDSGKLFNEYDQRTWSGDVDSVVFPFEHQAAGNGSLSREAPPSFSASQVPYTKARLSYSEFTYRFQLTAGQKFIRLYFNPVSYGPDFDRSKAIFSVKAGGFILLHDFNVSVTADASKVTRVYREFCLSLEEEQSLNITFTPSRVIPDSYAFINGIEIVSMPTNLYYTASQSADVVKIVGSLSENNFPIENSTAMEMVYRIDIGGKDLSFNEDTGMYRIWGGIEDDYKYLDYLSSRLSVLPENTTLEPNFSTIKNYTAPKQVYQTARSMGRNATINKSYNLTWQFPVDPDFYYLVRLHFCEFQPEIVKRNDRLFLIYLANQTAEKEADILVWSNGPGKPVYQDYLVYMPEGAVGSGKKVNLSLALQANPRNDMTQYNDAILNGLEIYKLNNSKGNLAGPNPDPPPQKATPSSREEKLNKKSGTKNPPLLAVVAGVLVCALVVLSAVGFLIFRRRRKVKESDHRSSHGMMNSTKSRGSSLPSDLCRYFSLAEIKAATQNFNEIFIIGVGGFGHVYKGNIDLDGEATPVAIKRLKSESSQGAQEFKTEIEMLSQLRHLHLVSLIGYCTEEGEMILVYDYMARGTLRDHLYHCQNPPLSWEKRLRICIGAARGLHYLHTGAKYTIIHRDVKSTNILLDEKWVAKVSDFGLSKTGPTTMSKTHISTLVRGSFGYLDPEYYRRQQLTEKSDVYSFGVVLFEVLCARPALIRTVEKKQMNLAEWAKSCHRNGKLEQIIDPILNGKIGNACLNKFAETAVSCIRDNGTERPSMNDVVGGLEFALQLHQKAEGDSDFNAKEKGEDEDPLISDSRNNFLDSAGFSCSWEETSDSMNSGVAKTSGSEQCSTTNESIKGMSKIIFSGINDSGGR